MIMAYKAFNKDLTCTMGKGTFQYREGEWFEEGEANCRRNGFHCAGNPLDCLNYYRDVRNADVYIVLADGDINEDGTDTKISCTRIRLVKRLAMEEIVMHALKYLYEHPRLRMNERVKDGSGKAEDGFAIVRGKRPIASGALGDVLGMAQEAEDSCEIEELAIYKVGEQGIEPGRWYDIHGRKVQEEE
jgi:hypothetical protein